MEILALAGAICAFPIVIALIIRFERYLFTRFKKSS